MESCEPEGYENGYWYEPTMIANVNHDMKVVKEEIFGPVVVVMKFKDEKEAIRVSKRYRVRIRLSSLVKRWSTCNTSGEPNSSRDRHGQLSILRFPWNAVRWL